MSTMIPSSDERAGGLAECHQPVIRQNVAKNIASDYAFRRFLSTKFSRLLPTPTLRALHNAHRRSTVFLRCN